MRSGIAVIGDKDSVLAFKAIGLDVFPVNGEMEAREQVKAAARIYNVIYITEDVAKDVDFLLKRYKSRPFPVIVPIPSAEGSRGLGMAGIVHDIEKAIGSNIL